jgi:hypothetical protein
MATQDTKKRVQGRLQKDGQRIEVTSRERSDFFTTAKQKNSDQI